MPIQILATKLYLPAVGNLVQRASLLKRLQAGIRGRITIVSAPPGFGKSTLLAAWIASKQGEKVAWYSLDEDDNDPARFFAYLAASLRTIEPDSVSTLDSLLEANSTNPRELAAALIIDVSEFVSKDLVLILDDYHHITQQPIHDAVAYLIDHLPNNVHLVFISRADPPLPLGRWRVRGQLTEIRADDLRFTEDEAAQFLNQTMGLNLTAEDIRTLEVRTEGWVAGLQLAALSLQKSANPREVIAAFAGSHRFIADYLTDEVLARQSDSMREFLLKTSILERFNAPLCNAVLEIGNAETVLSELERANLFILPLDSESNWFRYHHLFGELLRRKLDQTDHKQVGVLHRRAAEWFEKNNLLLDATRHWIAADEPKRVALLVERAIGETWGKAELASLMRRVELLPEAVLAEHPSLSAFLGSSWLWLGYNNERIIPLLEHAERNLQGKPNAERYIGRFNVTRSFLLRAVKNDSPSALLLANKAKAQLAEDDLVWRGLAELNIAACTHSMGNNLLRAEEAYSETVRLCEAAGDLATAWIAACVRVQVVTERGNLGRAIALNRQLLDWLREKGSISLVRGWAHANQAGLMYQVNDLDAARHEADTTSDLETRTGGMPDVGLRLCAMLTKLELAKGNESAARKAAREMIELARRSGVTNATDWSHAVHAELMFRLEDWSAFDAWAQAYEPSQQPMFFPYRLATLMYARFLMRRKAWDETRRILDEQARLAKEAGYVEYEMELDIARAILEKGSGHASESMQALQRALNIGAAGGYVRMFVDEGDVMKNLLSQSQKQVKDEALRAYVTKLLAAFDVAGSVDQSALIEPLTERELEVLKLIAEGMSNPEIAEKLVLSVGTVKTHVKHIYGKLGVDDRVKAAGKARELGLIN